MSGLPAKGPGRPKGSVNKLTRDIKEAVYQAFEKAGGVDYLVKVAQEHPQVFCALVGKVIPQEVNANLTTQTYVVEVPAKPASTDEWKQQHAPTTVQ